MLLKTECEPTKRDMPDRQAPDHDPLNEPQQDALLRLTRLVEHLFRVPVAYMALLDGSAGVSARIGSGEHYWGNLRTFPSGATIPKPAVWPNPSGLPIGGFEPGDLKFVAAAPLQASDGLHLGVLVIADIVARPEFRARDLETLAELAEVLAGKMELRLMACIALESESACQEAENRFRNIADSAPFMIIYSDVDGGSSFVNRRYLEFTGRNMADELGDGFAETFHPEDRERVVQAYWSAFEARTPLTVRFQMRRHDGEYRCIEAQGTPRFLDNGSYAGYMGCFTEVTDGAGE